MSKYNIDEIVEKMLEHADKYPELKLYAEGLKNLDRASKSTATLTKDTKSTKIGKNTESGPGVSLISEPIGKSAVEVLGGS